MEGSDDASDAALLSFLQPDETMKDCLLRTFVSPFRTSFYALDEAAVRPGNVVEICGASGSGKTEVLMQAIATCILPEEAGGVGYGGAGGTALCFDLDSRFDILRLARILEMRINEAHAAQGAGDTEAMNQVFSTSLQRLRMLRCYSSFHFLAALKMIQVEIRQLTQIHGQDSLRLICIDSIGAFYWLDKGLQGVVSGPRQVLSGQVLLRPVVNELKHVMKRHRPLVLATKSAISASYTWQSKSSAAAGAPTQEGNGASNERENTEGPKKEVLHHKEYMPASWQDFVTHRLVLQGPSGTISGNHVQHDRQPYPVFAAQWDKPPAPAILKFVILDGCCRSVG